ncbi:MAG TPA: hypothetical protein VLH56_12220 [Dissulfurispiraceae bacterium]|nr:hypothetical protein [Dissulfurispiraceae bacterium]
MFVTQKQKTTRPAAERVREIQCIRRMRRLRRKNCRPGVKKLPVDIEFQPPLSSGSTSFFNVPALLAGLIALQFFLI